MTQKYVFQWSKQWLFLTEVSESCVLTDGLFNSYISQQDYKPSWNAIDPAVKGKIETSTQFYYYAFTCMKALE